MLKFCLIFLFGGFLILHGSAQNELTRFTQRVGHYRMPDINTAEDKCIGTVISKFHVLTTASCVTPRGPTTGVAVRQEFPELPWNIVLKISIHPSYRGGQRSFANIALLDVNRELEITNVPLFSLVNLPSNTSCSLFGWGQTTETPRRETVSIYNPEFCNPSLSQVSCSIFESTSNPACTAMLGSPIICDNDRWFSGFLITEGCVTDVSRVKLNYHSINSYRIWINEVLRADNVDRVNSEQFVAQVMLYQQGNIGSARNRCAGTIIDQRHVLTTAACVDLPTETNQAVAVQGFFEGRGRANVESDRVYIHPEFATNQVNNIAVIRTSVNFNLPNIFPLPLGTLPTNTSELSESLNFCQVVGWHSTREVSPHHVVAIYGPEFCNPNYPQAYCSVIDSGSDVICSAAQGSPVLCAAQTLEGFRMEVAGVVVSTGTCSGPIGSRFMNFHSVNDFEDWIVEVSGAEKVGGISMLMILIAVLINS